MQNLRITMLMLPGFGLTSARLNPLSPADIYRETGPVQKKSFKQIGEIFDQFTSCKLLRPLNNLGL
jgi:hypothetical protein